MQPPCRFPNRPAPTRPPYSGASLSLRSLAIELRLLRKSSGLTYSQLVGRSHYSITALSTAASGKGVPTPGRPWRLSLPAAATRRHWSGGSACTARRAGMWAAAAARTPVTTPTPRPSASVSPGRCGVRQSWSGWIPRRLPWPHPFRRTSRLLPSRTGCSRWCGKRGSTSARTGGSRRSWRPITPTPHSRCARRPRT
ncbi:helix-turn-helix domain-containing protein [Streptomyces kaempferi]